MLLWLYEDDKPSEYRLMDAMETMDKDESGCIDRKEWVKYLCSQNDKGCVIFRKNLFDAFHKADVDGSGSLDFKELEKLIESQILASVHESKRDEVD